MLVDLLRSRTRVDVRGRSHKVFIRCPFHAGGNERTPSCQVTTEGRWAGRYRCFACRRRGAWNDLALALDLPLHAAESDPLDSWLDIDASPREDFLSAAMDRLIDCRPPRRLRGIPFAFLRRMGCRTMLLPDRHHANKYLIIPAIVSGRIIGAYRMDLSGTRRTKYWSVPNSRLVIGMDTAVKLARWRKHRMFLCVEGAFDAIPMLYSRVPAVSVGGTGAFEIALPLLLSAHPRALCLLFDNDLAGIDAAEKIVDEYAPALEKEGIMLDALSTDGEDGLDPGDMSPEEHKNAFEAALEITYR